MPKKYVASPFAPFRSIFAARVYMRRCLCWVWVRITSFLLPRSTVLSTHTVLRATAREGCYPFSLGNVDFLFLYYSGNVAAKSEQQQLQSVVARTGPRSSCRASQLWGRDGLNKAKCCVFKRKQNLSLFCSTTGTINSHAVVLWPVTWSQFILFLIQLWRSAVMNDFQQCFHHRSH
ncbi:hypothetical protein C8F04DRAFT_494723 [Mycena alexandri]|uniref:Uncharacterized protein n=1 Tax=Mycena alexandri TaxID=1745969 RepID=A0AAD6SYX1_9AGAR|nr:hypothetical protein C8F04DRAFT_494723 [Mycena alexandri]